MFVSSVVGLFCEYYWLERLVPEMTCYVSSGMLNFAHSLTYKMCDKVAMLNCFFFQFFLFIHMLSLSHWICVSFCLHIKLGHFCVCNTTSNNN